MCIAYFLESSEKTEKFTTVQGVIMLHIFFSFLSCDAVKYAIVLPEMDFS